MQISTKDLSYLSDEMSWELLAMKKCNHFAQECQDEQVRQLLHQVGQMHQNHYEMLLNQLQQATEPTGAPGAGNPSVTQ
ncbi:MULTISPECIES: spore coat protein [Thermoactinomyces]|jgi:hypothetical protein|uniref:spore coat protein n=1 Tax=Thermoactinomyces TaxID=2023 RepID=UPI000505C0C4|nr:MULTISPECIES: spore coat protein [Thermoactinomyces]KFZ41023.1 hypothetical protein JS81_03860 [Thermoactinomyces sp. Gus2-1]KYQ87210.1 hypothetical protein AYX07_00435 [Thermoactinomyces sp. AS95]MBI0387636.1 spore coat protein [Thermoactinomyces sp. CICC 24227]QCV56688.1 spore coat protein [Thermoactinomyces vulgaris]